MTHKYQTLGTFEVRRQPLPVCTCQCFVGPAHDPLPSLQATVQSYFPEFVPTQTGGTATPSTGLNVIAQASTIFTSSESFLSPNLTCAGFQLLIPAAALCFQRTQDVHMLAYIKWTQCCVHSAPVSILRCSVGLPAVHQCTRET